MFVLEIAPSPDYVVFFIRIALMIAWQNVASVRCCPVAFTSIQPSTTSTAIACSRSSALLPSPGTPGEG